MPPVLLRLMTAALLVIFVYLPSSASAQSEPPPDQDWYGGPMTLYAPSYTLGAVIEGGRGMYTKGGTDFTPTLYGYRYADRMSIVSGALLGVWLRLLGVGMAGAIAAPRDTETTVTRSKDYRTGVVTETRTTTGTVTAEQGRQAQGALDSSEAAADAAIGVPGQAMEVVIYDQEWASTDRGDGWGYRLSFWVPVESSSHAQFEIGWLLGDVVSLDRERRVGVESYTFAFPIRLLVAFSQFSFLLQWDLNFSSFWSDEDRTETIDGVDYQITETRPWPLTLEARAVLWRFDVYGGLITSRPLDGDIGFRAGAGLRF